jgi:hypothetical protein
VASPQVQQVCTAVLAASAAAVLMWAYASGRTPSITVDERSVQNTYSPYAHFLHSSPTAWVRHFPETVGANCLPMPYQNQDIGLAVRGVEVTGGYAQ